MKFSIKYFFSKCDQVHNFLRIWSHLLKKSLMENFFFSRSVVAIILANSQCSLSPMTILLYGVVSVGGTQRLNIAKWAKGSCLHIFCPCLRVLTILWIQGLIRINVDINLVGFTDCCCC